MDRPESQNEWAPLEERFIVNRDRFNQEVAHFNLFNEEAYGKKPSNEVVKAYRESLATSLSSKVKGAMEDEKILSFSQKPPTPVPRYHESLRIRYSISTPNRTKRVISHEALCILDAPGIVIDYYYNLLSCSTSNIISVALESSLYVWHENGKTRGSPTLLYEEPNNGHITTVHTLPNTELIVVANDLNCIGIWDIDREAQLRSLKGHSDRITCLDSHGPLLSSGSEDASIINWDLRIKEAAVSTLLGHTYEVLALKWNYNGTVLASGGADHDLYLWSPGTTTTHTARIEEAHTASIKSIAWCPWETSLLASGADSHDNSIKFWNATTTTILDSIDTKGQVSALVWSSATKEIISSHRSYAPRIVVWQYPRMDPIVELFSRNNGVLGIALSPDNTTLLSAHQDETLKFWSLNYNPSSTTATPQQRLITHIIR